MRLIIGLGNPGHRYASTRHNVGFQVIEKLSVAHHIPLQEKVARSLVGRGKIHGRSIVLALPQTYMNRSGEAVAALIHQVDVTPDALLIVFDEMDLKPGGLRIRQRGSSGGHRGVDSIIGKIGTTAFPRIRIGIGRPPQRDQSTDFVLSPFTPEELPGISEAVSKAVDAVEMIVEGNIIAAMNKYNS